MDGGVQGLVHPFGMGGQVMLNTACRHETGVSTRFIEGSFAARAQLRGIDRTLSRNPEPANEAAYGDLNGDGVVDVSDLLTIISAWGTPDADITGDNMTDVSDLLIAIGAFGQCP